MLREIIKIKENKTTSDNCAPYSFYILIAIILIDRKTF